MRAFIFSLDAFVAFTLALVAIYSLIFFSSVPASYYYLLTQGHFLARDVMMALSTTECTTADYGMCPVTGSLLDNIVSGDLSRAEKQALIMSTAGAMIPNQFGYSFELSENEGRDWALLYDTASSTHADEDHTGQGKKLEVTSQIITFGYDDLVTKPDESMFRYSSCHGDFVLTCTDLPNRDTSEGEGLVPEVIIKLVRVTIYI